MLIQHVFDTGLNIIDFNLARHFTKSQDNNLICYENLTCTFLTIAKLKNISYELFWSNKCLKDVVIVQYIV